MGLHEISNRISSFLNAGTGVQRNDHKIKGVSDETSEKTPSVDVSDQVQLNQDKDVLESSKSSITSPESGSIRGTGELKQTESSEKRYEACIAAMTTGEKEKEAVPLLINLLKDSYDIETLERMKDFGVAFNIFDKEPPGILWKIDRTFRELETLGLDDFTFDKMLGTYDLKTRKIDIPFESLTQNDTEVKGTLLHELTHAEDHYEWCQKHGDDRGKPDAGKHFASMEDEDLKTAYKNYSRRTEPFSLAQVTEFSIANKGLASRFHKDSWVSGNLNQRGNDFSVRATGLEDGKIRVDEHLVLSNSRKKKLALALAGVTVTAAAAPFLPVAGIIALSLAGAASISVPLGDKGIREFIGRSFEKPHSGNFTSVTGEQMHVERNRLHTTVTMNHHKTKEELNQAAESVMWSPYAYTSDMVSEYNAELGSRYRMGPQEREALRNADPEGFMIAEKKFGKPPV